MTIALCCDDLMALRVLAFLPAHTLDSGKVPHLRALGLVELRWRSDLGMNVVEYRATEKGRAYLRGET